MEHIFKSDADFKQNVKINKTLTAEQIKEKEKTELVTEEFYADGSYTTPESEPLTIKVLGAPDESAKWGACEITINKYIDTIYNNITVEDVEWQTDSINIKPNIINCTADILSHSYNNTRILIQIYTQTEPLVSWIGNTLQFRIELEYKYVDTRQIEQTVLSYKNLAELYGDNGILHDIQNRLENLKSNFESIGFKYKASNEFSSSIETLEVDSATVDDVILPKEVYDGEKTSLVDILKDIDQRLDLPFRISKLYGTITHVTDASNNTETKMHIGFIAQFGQIIYGVIWSGPEIISRNGYEGSQNDITNIVFENEEDIWPAPYTQLIVTWTGDYGGVYRTYKDIILENNDNKLNIRTSNVTHPGGSAVNNTNIHWTYFTYSPYEEYNISSMQ